MYEGYWKLKRRPFEDGPGPEFYFPANTHQAALLKLRYLIDQRKGIGLLAGEHGLGKTFLTQVLEHDPQCEGAGPFVRLVIPQLSPAGTLSYLAHRLGAEFDDRAPDHAVLRTLESRLEHFRESRRHPVLLIDDAHLLDVPQLNSVRLLMNLREQGRADFSVILSGRTELLPKLRRIAALPNPVLRAPAPEALAWSTSSPENESTSTFGKSATASFSIARRSSTVNSGSFPGFSSTATTSESKHELARRKMSIWPCVTGSNVPGQRAAPTSKSSLFKGPGIPGPARRRR
jgi:hypothetical protein